MQWRLETRGGFFIDKFLEYGNLGLEGILTCEGRFTCGGHFRSTCSDNKWFNTRPFCGQRFLIFKTRNEKVTVYLVSNIDEQILRMC